MEFIKNSQVGGFEQLTEKQRIVFFLLFFMVIAGGSVVSLLMSIITPGVNPEPYGFSFQIFCILGNLLLLRRAHKVRLRFLALFFVVLCGALFLGLKA